MAQSSRITERQVNDALALYLRSKGFAVLQEVRSTACEIDLVAMHVHSKKLAGFEIKLREWKRALNQAKRTQMYCHMVWVVLPESLGRFVDPEPFMDSGIGLTYFDMTSGSIQLRELHPPKASAELNRSLRKRMYKVFSRACGDFLDA